MYMDNVFFCKVPSLNINTHKTKATSEEQPFKLSASTPRMLDLQI